MIFRSLNICLSLFQSPQMNPGLKNYKDIPLNLNEFKDPCMHNGPKMRRQLETMIQQYPGPLGFLNQQVPLTLGLHFSHTTITFRRQIQKSPSCDLHFVTSSSFNMWFIFARQWTEELTNTPNGQLTTFL